MVIRLIPLFARQLKCFHTSQPLLHLATRNHTSTSNPVKILEEFQYQLARLYSASPQFDPKKAEEFFSSITLPPLPSHFLDSLEADSTLKEVNFAIKTLKTGKRQGQVAFQPFIIKTCGTARPQTGFCLQWGAPY